LEGLCVPSACGASQSLARKSAVPNKTSFKAISPVGQWIYPVDPNPNPSSRINAPAASASAPRPHEQAWPGAGTGGLRDGERGLRAPAPPGCWDQCREQEPCPEPSTSGFRAAVGKGELCRWARSRGFSEISDPTPWSAPMNAASPNGRHVFSKYLPATN